MSGLSPPPIPAIGPRHVVRGIARGGLAGFVTGLVLGGGGGRLAMRISSLIDPVARGRTTEGGAKVGEFTLAGTLELIIFIGILTGLFLALIWVAVRPWLPTRGAARYGAAAVVGVAMGGRFAIDGGNLDFLILGPALGQAAIFIVLAALTGAAVVAVDGRLERMLPSGESGFIFAYGAVALAGVALAVPFMFLYFETGDCSCVSPPRLVGGLLIVVGLLTATKLILGARGTGPPRWLARVGPVAVAAMCAAGLLHLAGEIAHFV